VERLSAIPAEEKGEVIARLEMRPGVANSS